MVGTPPSQIMYGPHNNEELGHDIVIMTHDELEALKVKALGWLNIYQWATLMWIGKSTFANTYNNAVKKATQALLYGKSIYIETAQEHMFEEPLI